MTDTYSLVELDAVERSVSPLSGVSNVELTERLGCTNCRARTWYLEPGESLVYHRQREQEELYIPLSGPGQLRIDGDLVDVPAGSVVRIPPETPRQPVNESDRQHTWLIVGAPATENDGVPIDE